MFSKATLKLNVYPAFIILIFSQIFLCACGLKLNEKPKQDDVVELKSSKCLDQATTDLKLFFEGNATDVEAAAAVDCFSQILLTFKDNIKGQQLGLYKPQELAYFIEKNLISSENKITPEFLDQIMKFKKSLVGGNEYFINAREITLLSGILAQLKIDIVKINPYMKILISKWDHKNLDDAEKEYQFQNAKIQASELFEHLFANFARSKKNYQILDFVEFIKQTAVFAKANPDTIATIEKSKPFITSFKLNLLGGDLAILPADWEKISMTIREVLFQYLRIEYFLNQVDPNANKTDIKWNVYEMVVLDTNELVATLLKSQNDEFISNEKILDLVSSLFLIFSEKPVTLDLIQDIGLAKTALLGSDNTSKQGWSSRDLRFLNQKIPQLFAQLKEIQIVFDQLENKQLPEQQFNQLENQFNASVKQLSTILDGEVSLSEIKKALIDFEASKWLGDFKLPDDFESLYQIIISVKYSVTGERYDVVSNKQLRNLLIAAGRSYFHYTEYQDYLSVFSFNTLEYATRLSSLLPKIHETIDYVLEKKSNEFFSKDELNDLFLTLKTNKFYEWKLTEVGFDQLLNIVLENVLNPIDQRLSGESLKGLNQLAFDNLFTEVDRYLVVQKEIFSILPNEQDVVYTQFKELLTQKLNDPQLNELTFESLLELQRVQNLKVPYHHNALGFVQILDLPEYIINRADVLTSNLTKALSRLAIRSFAKDLTRINTLTGVNLEEAQGAMDKVKKAVVELELIEETNTTFISSRFRESNLFIESADGNDLVGLEELHDLILHITSGMKRSDVIREQVVTVCLPGNTLPVSAGTPVVEDCLLEQYFQITHGFEDLPGFINLRSTNTPEQNKAYYTSLLKAAGYVPNPDKVVYFTDSDLFAHITQYIEMIFLKYDSNRDGFLITDEAMMAYPVFKETIRLMLKTMPNGSKITEEQLPGVFFYLLKFRRPPKGLGEILKFIKFIDDKTLWVINTNRIEIGEILNFIAASTAPVPPTSTPVTPAPQPAPVPTPIPEPVPMPPPPPVPTPEPAP